MKNVDGKCIVGLGYGGCTLLTVTDIVDCWH